MGLNAEKKTGRWECLRCHIVNDSYSDRCIKCGVMKDLHSDVYSWSSDGYDAAVERALEAGHHVIKGDDYQLQLDLDDDQAVHRANSMMKMVSDLFGVMSVEDWRSKSGHTHRLISLEKPLPVASRIALQAALGSDPRRELLGIRGLVAGVEDPNLLFRPHVHKPALPALDADDDLPF